MTVRILATGDIHIGRRPTRVPDAELANRASASRMWGAVVSRAITERVDVVLLSGDVVDHDNRFYEATGPLERGIIRLADAGIPTYAVAGNHDWDVFPRILQQLDTPFFHLLGQGGRWEETFLERDGERILRIVGWSFPARHVRKNPLLDFRLQSESRMPTVGLLHADLDAATSEYAPVRLSELQSRDLTLWVLGHIHKPQYWRSESGASVLYPGSPQALGPNESGPHGPWLIELEGMSSIACQQFPMSRVRYEERDVDLAGIDVSDAFETSVNDTVSNALENVVDEHEPPELLSLRLNFVGATRLCGQIDSLTQRLEDLMRVRGGVLARIDKLTNSTRPAVDLDELAKRNDPVGVLARVLVALQRNEKDETSMTLIDDAAARFQDVYRATAYVALVYCDATPDRETSRQMLIQQGRQLLETLRSQIPQQESSS